MTRPIEAFLASRLPSKTVLPDQFLTPQNGLLDTSKDLAWQLLHSLAEEVDAINEKGSRTFGSLDRGRGLEQGQMSGLLFVLDLSTYCVIYRSR